MCMAVLSMLVVWKSETKFNWLKSIAKYTNEGSVIKCTDCAVSNPCAQGDPKDGGAYAVKVGAKFLCLMKIPKDLPAPDVLISENEDRP